MPITQKLSVAYRPINQIDPICYSRWALYNLQVFQSRIILHRSGLLEVKLRWSAMSVIPLLRGSMVTYFWNALQVVVPAILLPAMWFVCRLFPLKQFQLFQTTCDRPEEAQFILNFSFFEKAKHILVCLFSWKKLSLSAKDRQYKTRLRASKLRWYQNSDRLSKWLTD